MFIDPTPSSRHGAVRTSGDEVEFENRTDYPLVRTARLGLGVEIYKHATPNGVKTKDQRPIHPLKSAVAKNFGGRRALVICSNAYAIEINLGSLYAPAKKDIPTGSPN